MCACACAAVQVHTHSLVGVRSYVRALGMCARSHKCVGMRPCVGERAYLCACLCARAGVWWHALCGCVHMLGCVAVYDCAARARACTVRALAHALVCMCASVHVGVFVCLHGYELVMYVRVHAGASVCRGERAYVCACSLVYV